MKLEIVQLSCPYFGPSLMYGIRRKTLFGYKYLDFDNVDINGLVEIGPYGYNNVPDWHRPSSQYFADCFSDNINQVHTAYMQLLRYSNVPKFAWTTYDEIRSVWITEVKTIYNAKVYPLKNDHD